MECGILGRYWNKKHGRCYNLNIDIFLKFVWWNLIFNVPVLREVFRRWLDHADSTVINRVDAFVKQVRRSSTALPHIRGIMCKEQFQSDDESVGNLILDFPGYRTGLNKISKSGWFCCGGLFGVYINRTVAPYLWSMYICIILLVHVINMQQWYLLLETGTCM